MSIPLPHAYPITSGPAFHFFGYYDKFQVDATGTRMLTMETDFMDRMPTPQDTARIGIVDLSDDHALTLIAETQAWCWQQSCMLQWLPSAPAREIIFNVRRNERYEACVLDTQTGAARFYERPVYTLSTDGAFALCPNFSRLATLRPGYGYEGVPDPWADDPASDEDGIYYLDLATGESRLIISLAQIAGLNMREAAPGHHWFNHLLISPDNRRFIFLHRWQTGSRPAWKTRLFTAAVDGTDICCLNDHDMTSHFIWKDARTILAWATRFDTGNHYYLFTDQSDRIEPVAPAKLTRDGHMSYRTQGDWFVTDTYPIPPHRERHLLLYNETTDNLVDLGGFHADPDHDGPIRSDLHPRWSRDGRLITFDSLHEGPRQIYAMDVGTVVSGT